MSRYIICAQNVSEALLDPYSKSYHSQEAIFRVVAAILHLGNVEFAKGQEIDSSVLKDDKSKFHLQAAVDLLMYYWNLVIFIMFLLLFFFLFYL